MLNFIVELGQLTSVAVLAYGALLCMRQIELVPATAARAKVTPNAGCAATVENGALRISI